MEIKEIRKRFTALMGELANAVSSASTPDLIAPLLATLRNGGKALEDNEKLLKPKVIEFLSKLGSVPKDQKQFVYTVGGWRFTGYPKTGTDPKKFEAILIAKSKKPKDFMTEVVSYKCNTEGIAKALRLKVLTQKELDECEFDESWTIKTPEEES